LRLAAAALRRVQADCSIEIDTNAYSVPSRLSSRFGSALCRSARRLLPGVAVDSHSRSIAMGPVGRSPREDDRWHVQGTVRHGSAFFSAGSGRRNHLGKVPALTCSAPTGQEDVCFRPEMLIWKEQLLRGCGLGKRDACDVRSRSRAVYRTRSGPGEADDLVSTSEGINEVDARPFEIGAVTSGDDETMDESGGGDKAVLDRHGMTGSAKTREQLCPP
jgi:hypothetical protein